MAERESQRPLVSIIIPSFNHRPYVEQGVRAALGQTYSRCEVIVVDDASSDGSGEFLEQLAGELGFRVIRNPRNLGLNATLQVGLDVAEGAFVSMIASDDWLAPDKIEWQVAHLDRTGLDGVYGTGWAAFDDGRVELMDLGDFERHFADGSVLRRMYVDDTRGPLMQTALMRRQVITKVWGERGQFKSDDWFTLIKLLEDYRIGFVNRPCFYYRQHESNSFRDYWRTLPMRLEVVCNVTPEELRAEAVANMLASMAGYLERDRKLAQALKFRAAAAALHPAPANIARNLVRSARAAARKVVKKG